MLSGDFLAVEWFSLV